MPLLPTSDLLRSTQTSLDELYQPQLTRFLSAALLGEALPLKHQYRVPLMDLLVPTELLRQQGHLCCYQKKRPLGKGCIDFNWRIIWMGDNAIGNGAIRPLRLVHRPGPLDLGG